MKPFLATLAMLLLLVAAVDSLNAQEIDQDTEAEPAAQQMPMMQGMMGRGMMGQTPMMQGGMMGGQGGMMQGGMMGSGMMCPMCGKMMQGGMMQGMMGGQGGMMGRGMMQSGMMSMDMPNAQKLLALADELKLKDEQIKSLKTLSLNSQKKSISQGADLSIAKLELNSLLGQEEIDLEPVQQKVKQVAQLEADLKIAHIKASIEAKEVLTKEQQVLLKEITKKKATAMAKPAAQTGKAKKMMPQATEHEMHH
ncbi:hypothetical protein H8E77_18850 [bacterium]|nr:hypothetical protein [bacterium]